MLFGGPIPTQGFEVLRGSVALVRRPAIRCPLPGELGHHHVTAHLGQHGCGRNGGAPPISLDNGRVRKRGVVQRGRVDAEAHVERRAQQVEGSVDQRVRRPNVQPIDGSCRRHCEGETDSPRIDLERAHRSERPISDPGAQWFDERLPPSRREQLGVIESPRWFTIAVDHDRTHGHGAGQCAPTDFVKSNHDVAVRQQRSFEGQEIGMQLGHGYKGTERLVACTVMTADAFIVPLKRFDVAKDRLRQSGSPDVTALARQLARNVITSCAPRHVVVLSEAAEVSSFARALGVEVIESDATTLNDAVQRAYETLSRRFDTLVIVHGDLAAPDGLGAFSPEPGITIVTDRHQRGTNVLAVPTGLDFHFAYGADSALHHREEAERLGVQCHVIIDSPWRVDIDEPEDLAFPLDGI